MAEETSFTYAQSIERFLKTDIIQFANRRRIKVKDKIDFLSKTLSKREKQDESVEPVPKEFARFDNKQAKGERYFAEFIARCDKAIDRERAKQAKRRGA